LARRVRRTSGLLDLRSQAILRAVIEEYVGSAIPVGSQALVDRYRLGVSSATVRNILAELEMTGLLTHPHTSAGRIPTDAGYRYYVESMAASAALAPVEQLMIRHQFGQVEFARPVPPAWPRRRSPRRPTSGGSTSWPSTNGSPA